MNSDAFWKNHSTSLGAHHAFWLQLSAMKRALAAAATKVITIKPCNFCCFDVS